MRVMTVVGNRPQFVKAAAVSRTLREDHDELLVHTGQHFDENLSDVFFSELDLPAPDRELGVAGGSNTAQTARMLEALEPVLVEWQPAAVLVYGDTNSTLAGALAGAQANVPVAHVEAGMRSGDRAMPEEINRVLTDHISTLLLCSSDTAVENLRHENVFGKVELVGDVMVDIAFAVQPLALDRIEPLTRLGIFSREYLLATAHRVANVDDPVRLRALVEVLTGMPLPVVIPLHPRTRARLQEAGLLTRLTGAAGVIVVDPLGYLDFTSLLCHAAAVLTDSGGLQKEAYLAGVPCVTLRPSTEWIETVQLGWNVLVDLDREAALAALARRPPDERPPLYGDGHAGARVVAALTLHLA